MKMSQVMKTKYCLMVLAALVGLVACDKFLDVDPDNRTEVNDIGEVNALLGSAYSENDYLVISELMSDNVDDFGLTAYNSTSRFFDQVYAWEDVTESNNESPERVWGSNYLAIGTANLALQVLDKLGGPSDLSLRESYAEAYLCRAYGHFNLVNLFCMPYNKRTSKTDLGVPYVTEPETEFNPVYERGTVEQVYQAIEKDLEAGLAWVGDSRYDVPKYHFNTQAAYAFATRFYLYYEKYDRAIECAKKVLGSDPTSVLRDYAAIQAMPSAVTAGKEYVSSSSPSNLLLMTAYSILSRFFANYSTYNRYSHGSYLAATEGIAANNIWGSNSAYINKTHTYSGSMDKVIFWHVPYLFEYTDPVAGTGYNRAIYPAFTTDECLLNRAEANVMLGNYDAACADLNLWLHNYTTSTMVLTPESVKKFYDGVKYSTWKDGTIRKHMHRDDIDEEGSVQESMLQLVLGVKRIETMGYGQRWFDLKRYGIKVYRRQVDNTYTPFRVTDSLEVYNPATGTEADPRWAVQIPYKVVIAGMAPNPRNK